MESDTIKSTPGLLGEVMRWAERKDAVTEDIHNASVEIHIARGNNNNIKSSFIVSFLVCV